MFFFALITFLLVFFVVRYRQRPGYEQQAAPEHSTSEGRPAVRLFRIDCRR